jgi:crotonobetainyl-CoA:carnitine CoA-transferase CaiB-like acyl-CoA transferase
MLDHLRVVELSVWVAGPAAGGVLADWGADVIKVEPPEGDPMRRLFGAIGVRQTKVPPFELDNRGKRSIVLDLRSEAGIAAMRKLLETADVFLTNLRVDALERLGLDPKTVRARLPRIVYASVTGYGLEGPERDRAGYDIGAFWARSGAAATLVPPTEVPPTIRSGYGDHTTGLTVLAGLLGALLERERTGEGRLVEVSLLGTGIYCMGWDLSILSGFGKISSTKSRTLAPAPLVNCYKTADDRWFWLLGLEGDRHWPGLLRSIDRTDLAEGERFSTSVGRRENCAALIAELDELFATRTFDEWVERFDAHDVWWAPVNTLRDVLADPQANAAGMFVEMAGIDGEQYKSVSTPVRFEPASDHVAAPGRVPALGEHTAEVLAELGLS